MAASSSYHRVEDANSASPRASIESTSTTSLILERINQEGENPRPNSSKREPYDDPDSRHNDEAFDEDDDLEAGRMNEKRFPSNAETKVKKIVYVIGGILIGGWLLALIVYLSSEYPQIASPADNSTDVNQGGNFPPLRPASGKTITLNSIMSGQWRAYHHDIQWVDSADGSRDGLMLTKTFESGDNSWLVVEDLRGDKTENKILMHSRSFSAGDEEYYASKVWPSPDLKKVLIATEVKGKFRHSFTATYWIYSVEAKTAVPLIPKETKAVVTLAVWSPTSDAVAFVRDNNLFIRRYPEEIVTQVTKDGGANVFNGIPDWVYEEEVFSGNTALWWSNDGSYLAFLRTDEQNVPEYPVQFFISRPSGVDPEPGLESYPETELIKYPKAGAPNPVVEMRFWDMKKSETFSVDIENDFSDDQRLITEVTWAGGGKVLIRETNRESDVLRMVLVDVVNRSGKVVRELDVNALDGGWFEVSQDTAFVPADAGNGRPHDGYIDTVIHEGYNHLAYFSPMDSDKPVMLTTGKWEVVDAPSAVDLKNNLVYFVATKRSSIERHVYSVGLDGKNLKAVTDDTQDGRYDVSFSKQGGYALLSYNGPGIPWQKVIGTESGEKSFKKEIEDNSGLRKMNSTHAVPTFHYSTINVDGFDLNVVERRPPNFDPNRKYGVLFQVYGGPGSQQVSKAFSIDFQAYVAANLGYIVVTVDGRGTGYIGRKARCIIRGNLGYYEATDQIAAANIWKKKPYVDGDRIAIWGWSYGGFMTLKTLELDGGQTFKYGMAVAPVTDWRFYDSIYTERYMHTPQNNPEGYNSAVIHNTTALASNVRFLVMHGVADDNVHFQNTLTLLDKLDVAGVENYDVHVFPDSDHSIYFHNANRMVYDKLANWLVMAFNGEFYKWKEDGGPRPKEQQTPKAPSEDDQNVDKRDKVIWRGRDLVNRQLAEYDMVIKGVCASCL